MIPQTTAPQTNTPSLLAWVIQANGFNRPGGASFSQISSSDGKSRDGLTTYHAAILKLTLDANRGVSTKMLQQTLSARTGEVYLHLPQEVTKLRQRGFMEKTGEIQEKCSRTFLYRLSPLGKTKLDEWISKYGNPLGGE